MAHEIGQIAESRHPGYQKTLFLDKDLWFPLNAQPETFIFTFFNYQSRPRG